MKKDNIGHNNPPLELEDFIIKDERWKVNWKNKVYKYISKKVS